VTLELKAKAVGRFYAANDVGSASQPAASVSLFGAGKIAATYFSFSRTYLASRSPQLRGFLRDLTDQLFPAPLVEVKGSADVDVSVNRLGGKLAINLVNTSGSHWDDKKPLVDSIEPVGPVLMAIRMKARPTQITLEPGGQALTFDYQAGMARVVVPRLEIHNIVVVE